MYDTKALPEKGGGKWTEEGILHWGKLVYKKEQTLEEFLLENYVDSRYKYPLTSYSYLSLDNEYHERDDSHRISQSQFDLWIVELSSFIDKIDDDTVLVGVDYHI